MILVTGATGMTGQFVVKELLKRGYAVKALTRDESVSKVPAGAEVFIGDLSDADSITHVAQSVQGIIHTACTFLHHEIDIAAMRALVNAWQAGPFIYVSSLDVYGFPASFPVTEDHALVASADTYPQGQMTGYAYGKFCCEQLLTNKANGATRTDYAILRAPHIWGPHPKAHAALTSSLNKVKNTIVLPGETEQEWSQYGDAWIDVRDLARVIVDSFEKPSGEAMNTLSGHFSWHELYTHLVRLTNRRSEIIHKPLSEIEDGIFGHQFFAQPWRFNNERLTQDLAYKPNFSLEQTLQDTIASAG